jgi:hypothetical protein
MSLEHTGDNSEDHDEVVLNLFNSGGYRCPSLKCY